MFKQTGLVILTIPMVITCAVLQIAMFLYGTIGLIVGLVYLLGEVALLKLYEQNRKYFIWLRKQDAKRAGINIEEEVMDNE